MKKRIGIAGCGTAGIQLAYSLQNDFDVTIFHYLDSDEILKGYVRLTEKRIKSPRQCEMV